MFSASISCCLTCARVSACADAGVATLATDIAATMAATSQCVFMLTPSEVNETTCYTRMTTRGARLFPEWRTACAGRSSNCHSFVSRRNLT
ncbi:exported hypothetical protein [Burkholderia diffusa]|nr:exported hypothetical protein [Burkholderia diffusa]